MMKFTFFVKQRLKLTLLFTAALIYILISFGRVERHISGQTGTAPGIPQGLTASDSVYGNKVGLEWSTVRGATLYRVYRNTSNLPGGAVEIGTTQANFFFDLNAAAGNTFFYWVLSENGSGNSELSSSDQGTRALATPRGPVPPLEPPPVPPASPITAAKIELGKTLFWDEQLSSTRTVACGTCHIPARGGSDPRSALTNPGSRNPGFDGALDTNDDVIGSPGIPQTQSNGIYSWSSIFGLSVQVTGRKANSMINAAYSPTLFWDGRAAPTFRDPLTNAIVINNGGALESQSVVPPVSGVEMGHAGRNWTETAQRIANSKPLAVSPNIPLTMREWIGGRTYPELFAEAFGTTEVTPARIALAIGAYERTLYSDRTPVDLDAAGIANLTAAENRGRGVFNQSGCNVCHGGNLFTNNAFFNIGIRPQNEDTGRFQVTNDPANLGEFRVPSLRNVELRAPYMHNGRFQTLEDVVEFYNRGGDFTSAGNFPGNLVRPLNLTVQQKTDLVSFLRRPLTDSRVTSEGGKFSRPELYTESNRVPIVDGTGIPGTSGRVPLISAFAPPVVGNTEFTVSLDNAAPGANAVLVIDAQDPGETSTIPATSAFLRTSIATSSSPGGIGFASIPVNIPNDRNLIGRTFYGRWYVEDPAAANGVAVSQVLIFTVFGSNSAAKAGWVDFDGDGKTDVSIFRPENGNWWVFNSGAQTISVIQFGIATDQLAPADYDGDGKTDHAVFRSGTWYLLRSRDGFTAIQFGLPGDIPQSGDFDGDGKDDVAVYRPTGGIWYILASRDGFSGIQFGISTDRPVAADYDGDGRTDIAVYRDGVWYVNRSRDGFMAAQFGLPDDKPVLGDYDSDGKSELAVFRPSTGVWYQLRTTDNGFVGIQFGQSTDIPSPGDYDGDGKCDLGVFRPETGFWWIMPYPIGTIKVQQFGISSDVPIPAANVR